MKRHVAALILLVAATAFALGATGCAHRPSDEPDRNDGTGTGTGTAPTVDAAQMTLMTPDGRSRTYRVYVPTSLRSDEPAPLLLALHGGMGSGAQFESNSGFDQLAEDNRFIVVYPDGTGVGRSAGEVWNAGHCCGPAQADRNDVDDVGFVSSLLDRLEHDYHIDHARVFAAGHSNGAMMAYRLACELADRVVAVGVQSGALEVDDCHPSRPVSLLHIHGTADHNVPIDGGPGQGISRTDYNSPRASVETFAALDGCADSSSSTDAGHPAATRVSWNHCRDGAMVEMVEVKGANHAWMGHKGSRLQKRIIGDPFMGFDSSRAIWTFLAEHPRS